MFRFQYLYGQPWDGQPYKTVSTREVHVGKEDVQSRNNMFTMIQNRKFIIPFFIDKYAKYKPGRQYGTVVPPEAQEQPVAAIPPAADDLRKAEAYFPIPFFDNPNEAVLKLHDGYQPTYYEDMLQNDPVAMMMVKEIHFAEAQLAKVGESSKHYWVYRGVIHEQLNKLAEHLK